MKFANVASALPSRRPLSRLVLFSLACLLAFAVSSPRFGVAPAARAASSAQQKQVAGKVGATRPKESLRPAAATNVKPGGKASGKSLEGVHVETVCSQNQPITFGTPVNGTLANGDCLNPIENDGSLVDEYTFTGTAGQQVAVSMTSNVFDTFLYLLNPNGSVLAANDDIDPNSNPANTNSRIPVSGFITLPSSGTYSILANSFAPESRGAYTLTLTSGSTCNQTPTPININTTVNGTLANGDCTNPIEQDGTFVDFYSFNATAGQQVSVTLTSANFNAFVYLIMPNGDVVADNDGGGGTNARLPQGAGFGRLPITGTYTIIVNSLNVGESGSYSLSLSIAGSPCPSTPITTGQTLNGALADTDCHLIDDGSLIDAYTFSGTTGQAVVISMNSTDATLHPFVHLLAPDGSTVAVDGSQTGSSARIPTSGSFTLPSTGTYTILANSFAVGQTGAYTISLVNPSACTTVLSPTSLDVSGVGGTFNVTATTQPGCSLNAVSNVPWLVINTASINSNGVGTVNYTVAQNTTSAARTGTLTINGQTFTVNQGAACTYAVYPTVRPFREDGGTGRFTVITTSSCPWTATSNAPWITLTAGFTSGTGTGRVRYTVAANATGATRTGTITVNGQTHTVTQTSAGTTPQLQFSAATYTVSESDASKAATITVSRLGDTAGAATVEYATLDNPASVPCNPANTSERGTAYARCDYSTTVDTLTFGIGEASKTFTIPLINDAHVEGNETFQIELRSPQGATLGTPTAATVTITDDDTTTSPTNPIDVTSFFVRMQYLDFLSREPEPGEPWSAVLNNCSNVNNNPTCDRILVSSSFFGSPEFRLKGFFVFLYYKASFGSANNPNYYPTYDQIIPDMRRVTGQTAEEVIAKRLDFAEDWVQRTAFVNIFGAMSNAQFVDTLLGNLGITLSSPDPVSGSTRTSLVNDLNAGTKTRAEVLRIIVESQEALAVQGNRAFVAMQYYGYLRRTPDEGGYVNNLNALNTTGNSRQMVNGFLNSVEYRWRFGAQ